MLALNDSNGTAYKTSKVAEVLQISTSSVRKYAAIVEKYGAPIMKDDRQERLFTESDVTAFRHMRKLITVGKTMDEAGSITAKLLINEKAVKVEVGEVLAQNDRTLFNQMANRIEELTRQNEEMATVIHEMDRKQSHILAILNDLNAAKLEETAATVQVESEEATKSKRGIFGKWFSRG